MAEKQTKGRQKIDMTKRRESEYDRLITFSKRRVGLYKKASELCTLCGPELVILLFSPSGKPFSFASPNTQTIAAHYLIQDRNPIGVINETFDPISQSRYDQLNATLYQLRVEADIEKKRRKQLAEMAKARSYKLLCEKNVHELSDEEATGLKAWLAELMVKIKHRVDEVTYFNNKLGCSVDPNAPSWSNGSEGAQF